MLEVVHAIQLLFLVRSSYPIVSKCFLSSLW